MENIEKCLDQFFVELLHTPGPWAWGNTPHYLRMQQPGIPITIRSKAHTEEIATVWTHLLPTEVNSKLIAQSPAMLRELCRVYLIMLVKFGYGVNETVTSIRTTIWMQAMLASLCGQISDATGLDAKHVHDTFEQYATWINMHEDIPDDTHHT